MSLRVNELVPSIKYLNFKSGDNEVQTKPDNKKDNSDAKTISVVSSAVALASLGVAIAALSKKPPVNKESVADNKLIDSLKKEIEALKQEIANKKIDSNLMSKYTELMNKFENLKNDMAHQSAIDSLRKALDDVSNKITNQFQMPVKTVQLNGKYFPGVANVMNEVSNEAARTEMLQALRSEAAKRIIGVSKGLPEIPEHGAIRIPTSEIKPFASTGGMAIVPKEIAENLSRLLAGKQDLKIIVDMPLYKGRTEENVFLKLQNIDGAGKKFNYIKEYNKNGKGWVQEPINNTESPLELIDSFDVNVITDIGPSMEHVNVYKTEQLLDLGWNFEKPEEYMSPKTIEKMELALRSEKGMFEHDGLVIKNNDKGNLAAYAKVQTVFYENPKFELAPPKGNTANIYDNTSYNAGETERFLYFDKFFYESLLRQESLKHENALGADMIIGNDWQTGGISALIRQLTTVRKKFNLSPQIADKIQNTPIITIMHNAGLSGGAWHSQSKMLNILFGEHAATIAENSWMPNVYRKVEQNGMTITHEGLPGHLQNALMEGDGINPQMMALAYSDYIIPVSKGYANEIGTNELFGGARKAIFELRGRLGEYYGNPENIRELAKTNGIDTAAISDTPTMIGIVNGCDKANNEISDNMITSLKENLGIEIKKYNPEAESALMFHNDNKKEALKRVIEDIKIARESNGKENPMKIELPEMTDLTGVTEKTPIFVSAGRIVDQKGLDIFAESIKEYYTNYWKEGQEIPVFYVQGVGGEYYKNMIVNVKKELSKTNPAAAKRIVFANLFSEAGRYDCAKVMSDFTVMSSWFEPCGLVHKEIGLCSGSIPVVNRTGGLVEGLKEGENVIVSEFKPKVGGRATKEELSLNAHNFADAINKAVEIHSDENKYNQMLKSMLSSNFDWLSKDGAMDKYVSIMTKLNVIRPNIFEIKKIQ